MRDIFVNKSLDLIKRNYKYDSDTLDRVKYGLLTIYINITKLTVIFLVSLIFNTFKNTLIFCLLLNVIRSFAYGIHAKKSSYCYISSIVIFVIMPYLFSIITINNIQKIICIILSLISYFLFAPADTHKRPIVNKNQRRKLKICSIIICIIYGILCFVIKNDLVSNLIILSLITESIIINPITYKIFKLPYDNYKEYIK